eukprot:405165-Prymnesium_polylepis.1
MPQTTFKRIVHSKRVLLTASHLTLGAGSMHTCTRFCFPVHEVCRMSVGANERPKRPSKHATEQASELALNRASVRVSV